MNALLDGLLSVMDVLAFPAEKAMPWLDKALAAITPKMTAMAGCYRQCNGWYCGYVTVCSPSSTSYLRNDMQYCTGGDCAGGGAWGCSDCGSYYQTNCIHCNIGAPAA
jgi:hypothetical protein